MPYRLLDEAPTADVGFRAWGATLDQCFQAAADATLDTMLGNAADLQLLQRRTLRVEADGLDLALLRFLEELIFYKDAQSLFLRVTSVRVVHEAQRCTVEAIGEGEEIDASRHHLSADVKAVTLHKLGVRQTADGWEATVVLDV